MDSDAAPATHTATWQARLRRWRTWAFMVCVIAGAVAISTVVNAVGNPKSWTSAYLALAASGELRWMLLPLASISGFFLLVALVLTTLIRR